MPTRPPEVGTPGEGPTELVRTFTLGYQGRSLEEVLRTVVAQGIKQVLDVRERAVSRRSGFSRAELAGAFAAVGVEYVHLAELGCEPASRQELWRGGAATEFLDRYRERLEARPDAVAELVRRARSRRTLLLCLERDPLRCHRAVLAERLRHEGIPVAHLRPERSRSVSCR